MRRRLVRKKPQQQVSDSPKSGSAQFICCECKAVLSEGQLRNRNTFAKKCQHGHLVSRVRPFAVAFLQGFGWGTLALFGAAVIALVLKGSHFAIVGAAGGISSAIACKKMLDGMACLKLGEPLKWIARQRFSEAVGIWTAIIISSFLTAW